ncbi:MAG: S-layer homology domain-containing protein [Candidatus Absconditabacterales bacterium]
MKKILVIIGLLMLVPIGIALASSYEGDINSSNGLTNGLEVTLPCSPTSVSHGSVNATTCVISCYSNYTLSNSVCVYNGGGGGGGGSSKDTCPNGDHSPSFYDGICTGTGIVTTGTVTTGAISSGTVPPESGSIIGSPFSDELNDAYQRAYSMGITTMSTIQQADMTGYLIRSHMAKMIVNYAVKILGYQPDASRACIFTDVANESAELQGYMKLACQLKLMGINPDGTPKQEFNPNDYLTRAQFGTILSRTLWGDTYDGGDPYYSNHLLALQAAGIMNDIANPSLRMELRGYVLLMLMRAAE